MLYLKERYILFYWLQMFLIAIYISLYLKKCIRYRQKHVCCVILLRTFSWSMNLLAECECIAGRAVGL